MRLPRPGRHPIFPPKQNGMKSISFPKAGRRSLVLPAVAGGLILAMTLSSCATRTARSPACRLPKSAYPVTARTNVVDILHGARIEDPYRWLEDDNAPETKAWVEAQNRVTFGFLERIPQRDAIKDRLTQLWNYERYSVPSKQGGRYFFARNDGLQNQAVLYVAESLDATPRVLLDPNTLAADGTVALTG
jgi:prolyl oligopeptidase